MGRVRGAVNARALSLARLSLYRRKVVAALASLLSRQFAARRPKSLIDRGGVATNLYEGARDHRKHLKKHL